MATLSIRKRLALEIARKIRNNRKELHPLKQLFWECTQRCNLHCKHCGSDCRRISDIPDMPAEDFLRVIDSITPHVNPNEVNVVITGGEPLMRDDLEDIGLSLYRRGYPWGLVSNGLYLTAARLQSLMEAGLHAVTISLDGFADDHNWMRGHPDSYSRAMNAIRMLVHERELVWDVVTCVNRFNYPYLDKLKASLYSIGVRHWRLFTIFPVGRAAEHPEFQLTDEEFTGVMEFIKHARKEKKMHVNYGCEGFLGSYEGDVRDYFFSCNAGVSVGSILADGSISACPSIRSNFSQGNIYKDDFMDVWEKRFQPFRNREWMKKGICADCGFFRYCEGNGMHLRDDKGELLFCHFKRLHP
ncbi:TIGR04133 family radical SAM/SPASM protein [uncultured Bacteroides sp.]|uniref:TIGR04133 family radical SAM/SPASM protein n=1 Tax=uncultured Bacteroides sp. TaxID=162156 RepID=UPI0025E23C6C|nr:TIGR04133 family radical SAM/SPASM protein [uncultured Bacteroides sp.]